jgi:hypothetical protein
LMTAGFTADVGPGMWIGAELRPTKSFSIDLEVRGVFPAYVVASKPLDPTKPSLSPVKPDVSNVEALLVPCFRYSVLMACAVAHFGITNVQTPVYLSQGQSWGFGPRLGVEIPLGDRFAIRAYGDALFDFQPAQFDIFDRNLKWTQNVVSGFFGAGIVVNFK